MKQKGGKNNTFLFQLSPDVLCAKSEADCTKCVGGVAKKKWFGGTTATVRASWRGKRRRRRIRIRRLETDTIVPALLLGPLMNPTEAATP